MKVLNLVILLLIAISTSAQVREIKDPITGKLLERYAYIEDENGSFIKNGEYKAWYGNELIKRSGQYNKNKREGLWKFWDENGKIQSEIEYKGGLKNGKVKEYNKGVLQSIKNYVNDTLHGEGNFFDNSGKLYSKYTYNKGKLDGEYFTYDSIGRIREHRFYTLGKQTGIWKLLNTDGSTERELDFTNGIPEIIIGKWKVENQRKSYFEFNADGTVSEIYPMFEVESGKDPLTKNDYLFELQLQSLTLTYKKTNNLFKLYLINEFNADKIVIYDITNKKDIILTKVIQE